MNDIYQRPSFKRTGRFFLWGWLMLLVVLVSAAPSAAEPRTRLIGSAFDPLSNSVVVRPSQSKTALVSAPQDRRKAPDPGSGGAIVASPGQPNGEPAPSLLGNSLFTTTPAGTVKRLPWPAHGPRAPPAG